MQKALNLQDIHLIASAIANVYANPANPGAEEVIQAKYPGIESTFNNFITLYNRFYSDSTAIITKYNNERDYEGLYEYLEGSGNNIISDPAYWTIANLICYIANN